MDNVELDGSFSKKFKNCFSFLVGIINTEGAMWKDQRKFLHDKLRGFGMTYMGGGKKIMESRIMVSSPFSIFCSFYFRVYIYTHVFSLSSNLFV